MDGIFAFAFYFTDKGAGTDHFSIEEEAETEEEEVSVTIGFQVTDYLLRTRVRVDDGIKKDSLFLQSEGREGVAWCWCVVAIIKGSVNLRLKRVHGWMKLRKRRRRKRRRRLPTDNPRTPYIPKRGRRNEEKCHHAKEEKEEETNDDASLRFLLAEELEEEEEEEEEEAHLGCLQWSKKRRGRRDANSGGQK